MNDLQGFTSAQADVFIDAGGSNTVVVGATRHCRGSRGRHGYRACALGGQHFENSSCFRDPADPRRNPREAASQRFLSSTH